MSVRDELLNKDGGFLGREGVRERCGLALERNLPPLFEAGNPFEAWAIIGGGPSVGRHTRVIRYLKSKGVAIVSVNKSHDWLLEHDIVPDYHFMCDPKQRVAGYVSRPRQDVNYCLGSTCHPDVFDALKGLKTYLWHPSQDFPEGPEPDTYMQSHWPGRYKAEFRNGGGTTIGGRAMTVGHSWGTNRFHMLGMDSSRGKAGNLHAYEKEEMKEGVSDGAIALKWRGTKFYFNTNSHMARQQMDFDKFLTEMPERWEKGQVRKEFRWIFYGEGLTPFWAATLGFHAEARFNAPDGGNPALVGGYVGVQNIPKCDAIEEDDSPKIELSQSLKDGLASRQGREITL